MPALIDWDLAVRTAARLVPPGPRIPYAEAEQVVRELRSLAVESREHVARFTGLETPPDSAPAVVVDRMSWVRGNVEGFREVMGPLVRTLAARRQHLPGPLATAVGSRVTGAQVGSLLAFLSTKVLGQYEIFLPPAPERPTGGRLSLVAPNIVATERALGVPARDFRLWVCLHEETHRTQFGAVPWLKGHVQSELDAFVAAADLDPGVLLERLRRSLSGVVEGLRGGEASVLELVQTPEQRAVLDRVQGFMSLVEGHAEYVMDGVGPSVVPALPAIRARFDQRRRGTSGLDRLLRRVLGLDLKMRQYAEGARFVRGVVDRVGMDGFNQVWTSPQTLPSRAEVQAPAAWVERVLGA